MPFYRLMTASRFFPLMLGLLASMLSSTTGCLKVQTDELEAPAESPPKTAEELLERYIQALGGKQKLQAIHQRTVEARIIIKPEQGCAEDDSQCLREEKLGSLILQKADGPRMYRRSVLNNLVEERGYDGKISWQASQGNISRDDAEQAAIAREDALLHWYFDLENRDVKLSLEAPRDHDFAGKPRTLDGLRWQMGEQQQASKTLWFDRQSGLLAEEKVEIPGEGGQTFTQVLIYEDYREVDGVKIPHVVRLVQQFGQRSQEIAFVSQRVHHEPIPKETFAVPNSSLSQTSTDDPFLSELRTARSRAEENPKQIEAQLKYARAAWFAAHFDEAEKAANTVLKLNPREVEAIWYLARLRIMQGRASEARDLLKKAGKAGVSTALIAGQEAWLYAQSYQFDKVAASLERAGAGNRPLAERFRGFKNAKLDITFAKGACSTNVPIHPQAPLVSFTATLGDQKTSLIFDTAASDLIIDDELAKAAGVIIGASASLEQGGEMGYGTLKRLQIGDLTISNVPVDIVPHSMMQQVANQSSTGAVMGLRLLERLQVTIDIPARQLTFVDSSARCKNELASYRTGQEVPFWLHEMHLFTFAEMNETEGFYWVNTGIQGAAVAANERAFAHAGIVSPPQRRDNNVAIVNIANLAIPNAFGLQNQRGAYGHFTPEQSNDNFRVDGMIGLELLGSRPWTIDFATRKFYFAESKSKAASP